MMNCSVALEVQRMHLGQESAQKAEKWSKKFTFKVTCHLKYDIQKMCTFCDTSFRIIKHIFDTIKILYTWAHKAHAGLCGKPDHVAGMFTGI